MDSRLNCHARIYERIKKVKIAEVRIEGLCKIYGLCIEVAAIQSIALYGSAVVHMQKKVTRPCLKKKSVTGGGGGSVPTVMSGTVCQKKCCEKRSNDVAKWHETKTMKNVAVAATIFLGQNRTLFRNSEMPPKIRLKILSA